MSVIEKFEDIEAWRKARALTCTVYEITSRGEFARDYGLRDQMRRASVSVLPNIAEGFERAEQNTSSHKFSARCRHPNFEP
jgi:four helix bundle protein